MTIKYRDDDSYQKFSFCNRLSWCYTNLNTINTPKVEVVKDYTPRPARPERTSF